MGSLVRIDPPHPEASASGPHLPAPPSVAAADGIEAFLAGRKPTTLRADRADLDDFARFLGRPGDRAPGGRGGGQANAAVMAYRAHLVARGLSSATIARRLAAIRSVVHLARTLGKCTWQLDVEAPEIEGSRDTRGAGRDGRRMMLAVATREASDDSPLGLRNLALVRTIRDLGLRRAEALACDLADLDLEAGTPRIVGKGRTESVPLTLSRPAGGPRSLANGAPRLPARGAPVRPARSGRGRPDPPPGECALRPDEGPRPPRGPVARRGLTRGLGCLLGCFAS